MLTIKVNDFTCTFNSHLARNTVHNSHFDLIFCTNHSVDPSFIKSGFEGQGKLTCLVNMALHDCFHLLCIICFIKKRS